MDNAAQFRTTVTVRYWDDASGIGLGVATYAAWPVYRDAINAGWLLGQSVCQVTGAEVLATVKPETWVPSGQ